jgi:hypothetical protein
MPEKVSSVLICHAAHLHDPIEPKQPASIISEKVRKNDFSCVPDRDEASIESRIEIWR